jgi:hypothetical protein
LGYSPASYRVTFIAEQNSGIRNAVKSNCPGLSLILHRSNGDGGEASSESRSGTIGLPNVRGRTAEIQSWTPLVASNLRKSGIF